MSDPPQRLEISIGGGIGSAEFFRWKDGQLDYHSGGLSPRLDKRGRPERATLAPSPEEWAAFRRALDSARVWEWAPDYPDPGVLDGMGWSIEIEWGSDRITSHGSNAFPCDDDVRVAQAICDSRPTRLFDRFERGLRALVRGRGS